jgi:hypothetical protein
MSIDDFIAAQQQFIDERDFNEYLPTLWVVTPRQVQVNVLMDPPEGVELEVSVRNWAQQIARERDYCLAYKVDHSHLKIVARVGVVASEQTVAVGADRGDIS